MAAYPATNLQSLDEEERKRREASANNDNPFFGADYPRALPTMTTVKSEVNMQGTGFNNIDEPKKIIERQTGSLGEPKKLSLYEAPTANSNTKIPGPEAFTNVAAKDRTVSNVGVQYTPQDLQLKDNISKMDAIIKAGVDPTSGKPVTLEQIAKVNQIKQQAGFLRGGTDRRPVDANGFPIADTGNTLRNISDSGRTILSKEGIAMTFNKGTDQNVINHSIAVSNENDRNAAYNRTPEGIAKINAQVDHYNAQHPVRPQKMSSLNDGILPGMNESERIAIRSDNTSRANARLAANTSTENNVNASLSDREKNRIEALNVGGQNKLRDIQGQVALDPRTKENALKQTTLTDEDLLGNKTQRVLIPNAEGTGFVDGMVKQPATFETPTTAAKELMLKNKNNPAYVSAYIKRFGKLPY